MRSALTIGALLLCTAFLCTALPVLAPETALAAQTAPMANEPAQSTDGEAAERPIRGFYDALLYSMKHAKPLGVSGRYKRLEGPVSAAFDFDTMTKFIIGEDWKTISEPERMQLVSAFRKLTVADYARNFDDWSGESFVFAPKVEMRGDERIVASQMLIPNKQPIAFNYRMHKTPAGWRIVDIYLNGYISEVATRRSDFASTMKSGGAKALAAKLEQMAESAMNN